MSGQGKDQLIAILDNFFHNTGTSSLSFLPSFWQSFKSNFIFLLLYFISPVIILLLPVNVFYLFFKGIFTGFSATMLIEAFGVKGLYYSALTLLPSGIIQVMLFAFLGMVSLQEGVNVIRTFLAGRSAKGRKNKNALQVFAGQYLKCYVIGFGVMVASCLLEAFLLQIAI